MLQCQGADKILQQFTFTGSSMKMVSPFTPKTLDYKFWASWAFFPPFSCLLVCLNAALYFYPFLHVPSARCPELQSPVQMKTKCCCENMQTMFALSNLTQRVVFVCRKPFPARWTQTEVQYDAEYLYVTETPYMFWFLNSVPVSTSKLLLCYRNYKFCLHRFPACCSVTPHMPF